MPDEYQITFIPNPEESAWGIIGRGLAAYNTQQAGDEKFQRVCFALQAAGGEIAGGVLGEIYWDWLHVDLLWLKEEARGQGHGASLLLKIEEEACKRGAKHAFLDTFSFQAPDFYKKFGYTIFGELADFPAGQVRYFMTKELT